jgi:hypothetical protein
MPIDIENIIKRFEAISPAHGQRWEVEEIVHRRLHLTRSEDGHYGIFIEGTLQSFGPLPPFAEVQHSDTVKDLNTGRVFPALRIRCGRELNSGRILAHITYELFWRLQANSLLENAVLLGELGWLLGLIGKQLSPMTPERQKGLVGECLFLRMLLMKCHAKNWDVMRAIEAWNGHEPAKRDFYRTDIAVEAKATANSSRLHHIGSLDQLLPQSDTEEVFLFSVGIRQDSTAPKKIPQFIKELEALIVDQSGQSHVAARSLFAEKVSAYGYDNSLSEVYEREPGFLAPHLSPALFKGIELGALSAADFIGGSPPETVRSVSYQLEVMAQPLTDLEIATVLEKLLS